MKKAIVIGATSGIGRELARILVANQYKVGITGRRAELLDSLKTEDPDHYFIKNFDISDITNVQHRLDELVQELGGLDLLVISSGTGDINQELDFDIEKRTISTNVIGFTAIADWAFNFFKHQGYGHLAAISSIAGLRGSRYAQAYNASKAFQINYLEGLRQKAHQLGKPIDVTDIRPGFVRTDMAKGEGLFWVAPVEKAAKQIFSALTRRRKVVYITKRWTIIAVLFKLMPRFIYNRM